ncbi:MAG: hypothetical protein NTX45_23125 [Proteobacteria bacterium]|nr:hypothetical protein [Pseudomonadota bacterium]
MNNNDFNAAWAAISVTLKEFHFDDIKNIVKLAGFDINILQNLGLDPENWYKSNPYLLVNEIEEYFLKFGNERKSYFLNVVLEKILSGEFSYCGNKDNNIEEKLQKNLNRLGWQIIDKKALPKEILDLSDLDELDTSAKEDLVKAATRFRDGDLNGAISSSYAAIESVIKKVYEDNKLGEIDYGKSFQDRCKKAFDGIGAYNVIADQLIDIGWQETSVKQFQENLKGSLNQSAYVMQLLRNNMSDAHGTRPAIKALVFDCIKWAQIIISLLSQPTAVKRNNR